MKGKWVVAALVIYLGSAPSAQEPRTWSGVLSETTCGASHQAMAGPMGMSERECAFHCLKGLSKYVIVDEQKNVIPIANQDFAGMPLRLARPVRVTGVLTDNGIVVSRIEPPLVHAHIGHVMIAWRDTPGQVGLLTIAQNDTRVAAAHALLLSKATSARRHEAARRPRAARAGSDDREGGTGLGVRREEGSSGRYAARRVYRGRRQRVGGCQKPREQRDDDADRRNGGDRSRYRGGAEDTRSQRRRPKRPPPLAIFSQRSTTLHGPCRSRSRKCGS